MPKQLGLDKHARPSNYTRPQFSRGQFPVIQSDDDDGTIVIYRPVYQRYWRKVKIEQEKGDEERQIEEQEVARREAEDERRRREEEEAEEERRRREVEEAEEKAKARRRVEAEDRHRRTMRRAETAEGRWRAARRAAEKEAAQQLSSELESVESDPEPEKEAEELKRNRKRTNIEAIPGKTLQNDEKCKMGGKRRRVSEGAFNGVVCNTCRARKVKYITTRKRKVREDDEDRAPGPSKRPSLVQAEKKMEESSSWISESEEENVELSRVVRQHVRKMDEFVADWKKYLRLQTRVLKYALHCIQECQTGSE